MRGIGSSEGLKVSTRGQKLVGLIRESIKPMDSGKPMDSLLGAKFGTTDEIYVKRMSTPPK